MATIKIPRVIIAATGSGAGKTTVTVGLIAALRARGLKVAPFKCGPDYLDPGYHARAAGRSSPNLDGWMMGREGVRETFARAARDADLAIIEGMMGLYDSAAPDSDEGSTAEIAKWLNAPVILVADCSGMARSVGAIALGFARFDSELRLAGLICNNLGGRGHLELLREAAQEFSIFGGLPKKSDAAFPERHLGLFSVIDSSVPTSRLEIWGELAGEWFDLEAVLKVARSAPAFDAIKGPAEVPPVPSVRIGVAYDEAFHFYYDYNLARLADAGAEVVRFSPIHDRGLPEVDALYFGGGYPETAAPQLAANQTMIRAVQNFAQSGRPIYAECGGLMYLADGIRTLDEAGTGAGTTFRMAGLIPTIAVMRDSLQAIGYAEVETRAPSFLGPPGTRMRGHQFRYSTLEPEPLDSVARLYRVVPRWGAAPFLEGYNRSNVIASYVHAHWASSPAIPENLVKACARLPAPSSASGFARS